MPRLSALLVLPKGSATLPLEWPALKKCSLLLHKHTRGRSDPLFAAPRLKVRGIRVFAAAQHIHELAAGLGANHAYGILHGGKRVRAEKIDLLQIADVLHHLFKSGVQFGNGTVNVGLTAISATARLAPLSGLVCGAQVGIEVAPGGWRFSFVASHLIASF